MAYNKKIRLYLVIILLAGWAVTLLIAQIYREQKFYRDSRVLMGTFFEVVSPDKRAANIVFQEVTRLENLLSKYKEDSQVARLNRSGKISASNEVFKIIELAKEFSRKTDQAFDITVGPLVDLWGFTKLDFRVPAGSKIKQTLKLVGADKIILNQNNNVIEFKLSGMKIDLGGIAKGYALDRCVEELKKNNVKSCLINAGGQVYALGKRSGRYWKVAIRSPLKKRAVDILELTDQSVSTSGNYEQFFFKGGKRYCHIIDPRTGYPADKKIASVTIISDSATVADILSTAVFVLGEQDAEEILKNFPGIKLRIYNELV